MIVQPFLFCLETCTRGHIPEVDTEMHILLDCHTCLPVHNERAFADMPFHDFRTVMQIFQMSN